MVAKFQFHKGAIRTTDNYLKALKDANFNSIKVRLEPVNAANLQPVTTISIP